MTLFHTVHVTFGDDRDDLDLTVGHGEFLSLTFAAGTATARLLVAQAADPHTATPGRVIVNLGIAAARVVDLNEHEVVLDGFTARHLDPHNSLPDRAAADAVRVRLT